MRLRVLAVFLSAVQLGLLSTSLQAAPLTGEQLYDVACRACHSLGTALDHRVGPPLGGLLNRQAGTVDGYQCSEALRTSGWVWRLPTLLAWLTDPDAAIPNNAMNYVNPLTAEETQRLSEWLLQQP
ncbi:c-type cytochrome [Luminiphilus sp.]|nr:c-type cytochrome [Luminiphilus sp.]